MTSPPGLKVKRRWPLMLLAVLLMLIVAATFYATISARRPAHAVPGTAPILSVAVAQGGLVVSTGTGAFFTEGDGSWAPIDSLGSRVLVAGAKPAVYVASRGALQATDDLKNFRRVSDGVKRPTALTVIGPEEVIVAGSGEDLITSREPGKKVERPGKAEIVALAGRRSGKTLQVFAGGLSEGLSVTSDYGLRWRQLLRTPIRSLVMDSGDPRRLLAGTPGGILETVNEGRSWRFTGMRIATEALARGAGEWFAIGQDRLLYRSADGRNRWEVIGVSHET